MAGRRKSACPLSPRRWHAVAAGARSGWVRRYAEAVPQRQQRGRFRARLGLGTGRAAQSWAVPGDCAVGGAGFRQVHLFGHLAGLARSQYGPATRPAA